MRAFAFLAASLALAVPADAAPRRVASLNLCTDELVLMLAAPGQIVSVTHLAQDPAETPLWQRARRHRRNDGSLLSAAAMRPDLIVTMGGGARDRQRIADRLGIRMLDLPFAATLDDVAANIGGVASALGREAAGERLVARLAALRNSAPRTAIDTIWLGGGGRTVARGSLDSQWMALAGLSQRQLSGDRVSLETLLTHPPRVLLRSDYRQGQYSGQQKWLAHPAAARIRGATSVRTDGRRWTCSGPLLIDEMARLRRELAR